MGFKTLFPVAAGIDIGQSFAFVHIDASGSDVCILEPDLGVDSFLKSLVVGFAGQRFKDKAKKEIAGIAVGILRVRLEFRGAFDDQRKHFILGYWFSRFPDCLIASYVRDTAAMREDLQNANFPGIWNLREELVEGFG